MFCMGNASDGGKRASSDPANSNTFISTSTKKSLFITLLISFATFNIRGLGQHEESVHSKREDLGLDCQRNNVDICAVQETKVVEPRPGICILSNGYRLIWFEQKDGWHGGLSFVDCEAIIVQNISYDITF